MRLLRQALSLASLPSLRGIVRQTSWKRVALVAWLYSWVVMLTGEMLVVGGWVAPTLVIFRGYGNPWWDYPSLIVSGSGFVAQFPFLPTFTMIVAAVGTGIGITVASRLIGAWWMARRESEGSPATAGAVAGIVPGVAGLSALGACCCVTCVGPSVVAVVASVSATSTSQILYNDWYVSVFQIAMIWLALIAQERAVRQATGPCPAEPLRLDVRAVSSAFLRIGLIVAGITWSLAMFIEMGETPGGSLTPALLYHWVVEHQVLSLTAIAAGFFPAEFRSLLRRLAGFPSAYALRILLLAGAVTWGLGVPAPLVGLGLGGFLNELLGYLGAPAAWGAAPPEWPMGAVLLFHWGFQHLLLSGFAGALALAPRRTLGVLHWSVPRMATQPPLASPVPTPELPYQSG